MKQLQYPKLSLEDYTNLFINDNNIQITKETINICISGGGLTDLYAFGVLFVIHKLTERDLLKINHIYTASGGAIVSFFILLVINREKFEDKYKKTIDDILFIVNNNFRQKYTKDPYIIDNLMEIIEEIIPPDFYLLCNNKLFITIHTINDYYIQHKNIHEYHSNNHLINTIKCSCSIPFFSVKSFYNLYIDPNTNQNLYSFDGMYPEIIDYNNKILCIDVLFHKYPIISRFRMNEKLYDFFPLEGIHDTVKLFKFSNECQYIYFYNKQHIIIQFLCIFFTVTVFTIQQLAILIFQL